MDTTRDRTAPARSPDQQTAAGEQTRLLAQHVGSDEGATTAEYAITTLATYIAPGRTYFTLAGVPVRTG